MANALIKTRAQLMDALRLASELEHQLMCQYLFAVYSLKRYPYERWSGPDQKKEILTEAELERVRRWAMKITLITRQEMEHLGLALNLLSSIGGTPSFSRQANLVFAPGTTRFISAPARVSELFSRSRSGTTRPIVPRRTSAPASAPATTSDEVRR